MNNLNKWLFKAQSLFLVLTILATTLIFSTDKTFAAERTTTSRPSVNQKRKIKVLYDVKYINEADGTNVSSPVTKIDFSGNTVTEKAYKFKGFELVSENRQTITLTAAGNQTVVFLYRAVDSEELTRLKASVKEQIDNLKKAPLYEKADYKKSVDKAYTEKEVNTLFEEIRKIDETAKVQVSYQIKLVDKDGTEIAPRVTKLGFAGEEVSEKAPDVDKYIRAETEPKSLTLAAGQNEIVFAYDKTDEVKTLKEFISEKADPYKELTYSDINFAGKPEKLQEYIIKNIYRRKLAVAFYATDKDVDKLYNDLWNKTTDASLVRLARKWTAREDIEKKATETPGVYRYAIGITYDIPAEQMLNTENKIEEIINKYSLTLKTDFLKAKFIFDYLIKYTHPDSGRDKWGYNVYNYSSVLLGNAGVCEGYAIAFNRMAERLGLEAKFVPGTLTFSLEYMYGKEYVNKIKEKIHTKDFDRYLNHAWNQVKVDGKWYHLDSYHAAYFYHNNKSEDLAYGVFLKSDNYMLNEFSQRIWDDNFTEKAPDNYKGYFTLSKDI